MYRISPYYLTHTDHVRVQFSGVGYGELTICTTREVNGAVSICRQVTDENEALFEFYRCDDAASCKPIFFFVTVDQSYLKCTEQDCQYPDDVRFHIRPMGLRCLGSSAPGVYGFSVVVLFMVQLFTFTL